jgi:hypothetical protein
MDPQRFFKVELNLPLPLTLVQSKTFHILDVNLLFFSNLLLVPARNEPKCWPEKLLPVS